MGALEDFYAQQRAYRQSHPLIDAGINLIPYVGAAASVDDVGHNLHDGEYGEAALNALGIIPGGKFVKMGAKGAESLTSAFGRYMVRNNHGHLVKDGADVLDGALAAGSGGALGAYLVHLLNKQAEADKKGALPEIGSK
jgi:hypothetical protein